VRAACRNRTDDLLLTSTSGASPDTAWSHRAADARAALQASLTATGQGVRVQDQRRPTVAAYLEAWLERERDTGRFRLSTALHTAHQLRNYWCRCWATTASLT
jgi:hypothetical protein